MSTGYEMALTSLATCASAVRALNSLGFSTAKNALNSIVEEKLSEIAEQSNIEFMTYRTLSDLQLSAGWDTDNVLRKAIPLEKRGEYALLYDLNDSHMAKGAHGPWLPEGVTLVRRTSRNRP